MNASYQNFNYGYLDERGSDFIIFNKISYAQIIKIKYTGNLVYHIIIV